MPSVSRSHQSNTLSMSLQVEGNIMTLPSKNNTDLIYRPPLKMTGNSSSSRTLLKSSSPSSLANKMLGSKIKAAWWNDTCVYIDIYESATYTWKQPAWDVLHDGHTAVTAWEHTPTSDGTSLPLSGSKEILHTPCVLWQYVTYIITVMPHTLCTIRVSLSSMLSL